MAKPGLQPERHVVGRLGVFHAGPHGLDLIIQRLDDFPDVAIVIFIGIRITEFADDADRLDRIDRPFFGQFGEFLPFRTGRKLPVFSLLSSFHI